ncbi:MAG TPA: ABC transporter permease [Bryobacteraceae bacterium]|jgi:predicted permease|nr:ABC transporter permease [Bryobacteraceae bacterium]
MFEPLDRFSRDVRHACRSLAKTPAYAITAIVTLALGIGANTAIFSALDGVVLQPLPYRDPDRLVIAALYNRSLKYATDASYPDFLDWQRNSRSFEQMAAFEPAGFDLTNPGAPEHVEGYDVSADFFSTLGVELAVGRPFSSGEDRVGGMAAVVISDRLWRERFGGSSSAIGKPLTLNGSGYTIVGVLPPGFRFEDQLADVYTPAGRADPLFRNDRTVHNILCVARLRRGTSVGQAQAEMNTLQQHIDELNPATEKGLATSIHPLKQDLVGDIGGTLMLLLGAVGVVLLIACANVANLLLARSAGRAREFAVRRALGAGRMQIVRQIITESVLLSCVGGMLGLGLAKLGLGVLLRAAPAGLPRIENIGVNASVLLFALGVSIAVGLLFAVVPALKLAHTDLQAGIREGGRGSTGGHQRTQGVLAIAQVALALVLLSGAGLLFRTIHNLWSVNPGFDTQHIITFQAGLSPSLTQTAASTRAAYQQITERIREVPGVEACDLTALVPLGRGDNSGPFWVGPHPPRSMAEIPRALYYAIGPDYPVTMGIKLLRGRLLTQADTVHSELVIVVDDLMARTYFPGRDALGQHLTIPHWGVAIDVPARIVGVVNHVEQYGIDGSRGEKPQIYYSFYQMPDEGLPMFRNAITFAARTRLRSGELMPEVKKAVHGMSSDLPIYNIRTMRDLVAGSMSHQRFPMILLVVFAMLALLLATIGIYGVLSYFTSQRIPEIGVRMALGAAKWDVLQMLVGHGLKLGLAGVATGAAAAFLLTRVLSSFSRLLFGVQKTDPLTFAAVAGCLILAVLLACYIPARRAAQLDPMIALRHE